MSGTLLMEVILVKKKKIDLTIPIGHQKIKKETNL